MPVAPVVKIQMLTGLGQASRAAGKSLTGNWRFDQAKSVPPPNLVSRYNSLNYVFKEDGTFTCDPNDSGTYRVEGDKVYIKRLMMGAFRVKNDEGSTDPWTLSADKQTLTKVSSGVSDIVTLSRVRN